MSGTLLLDLNWQKVQMKKKIVALLLLPFFLAGCSSTFAYNNLDWLLYWYLDDYVELDKNQKKLFDVKLGGWLEWHRKEELVTYQQQLITLNSRLNEGPLDSKQWLAEFDTALSHWHRLRAETGPELIDFSTKLTDNQINQLFEELEDKNLEREEERADSSLEERLDDQIDDTEDQVKSAIGRLSKKQKTLIAEYAPKFKSNYVNWMQYRRAIQAHTKELMLRRYDNPNYRQELSQILFQPETFQSQAYRDTSDYNRRLFAALLADINLTLSAKQSTKLNKKIDDIVEDLDELINKK